MIEPIINSAIIHQRNDFTAARHYSQQYGTVPSRTAQGTALDFGLALTNLDKFAYIGGFSGNCGGFGRGNEAPDMKTRHQELQRGADEGRREERLLRVAANGARVANLAPRLERLRTEALQITPWTPQTIATHFAHAGTRFGEEQASGPAGPPGLPRRSSPKASEVWLLGLDSNQQPSG
jgi:hypothetical protein